MCLDPFNNEINRLITRLICDFNIYLSPYLISCMGCQYILMAIYIYILIILITLYLLQIGYVDILLLLK